jgi:hypothetical protein
VAKGRTPLGGDSGTPIVVWNDDGSCTLVAMHIAGIEDAAVSFAIPAWQLFEADNYVALPLGTRIVPINV